MRPRRTMGGEGLGWASWLGISGAVVLVVAVIGLTIYGGRVEPDTQHYEQVVPDDRLPH
jgi:hypothetical protein